MKRRCRENRNANQYQQLESKRMLAGNVSVTTVEGLTNLSGDELANQIQIVGSPGSVTIIPVNDTTVNGQANPLPIPAGLQFANIFMGQGADSVEITNIYFSELVMIDGQSGHDRIKINGINAQHLHIVGGSGNDVLEFHNTYSRSDIIIQGDSGDDTFSITSMAADRHLVLGAGDGSDTIAIDDLGVRKSVTINSGIDDDVIAITGRYYSNKTSIDLGDGNDALSVVPQTSQTIATFRRRLKISSGLGNDQVTIASGVDSNRKTRLNGDSGTDSLNTNGSSLSRSSVSGFEDSRVASLDAFYERLNQADVDTTPFGRAIDQIAPPVLAINNLNLAVPSNSGPVVVDDLLSLSGSEQVVVSGATVKVIDNEPNLDILASDSDGPIIGLFDTNAGTLTLSENGTVAEYESVLRTVTFDNLESPSFTGNKRIEFTINSNAGSVTASRNLILQGQAQPTLAITEAPLQVDRIAGAVQVDDQLGLAGGDFQVTNATITIEKFSPASDVLAFVNTELINSSFDGVTGVLTLTGSGSLADYQAALRSATYENTDSAFTGTKQILFAVTTAGGTASDTRSIRILTDAETIQNFATANDLQLDQTASGVRYIIETEGNDIRPNEGDSVRLKYRGTFLDGTQFDANGNATFPLVGIIPGFRDGLLQFSEESSGQIFIPAEEAYGEDGKANIPPNSILRFEVELLEVIQV